MNNIKCFHLHTKHSDLCSYYPALVWPIEEYDCFCYECEKA